MISRLVLFIQIIIRLLHHFASPEYVGMSGIAA